MSDFVPSPEVSRPHVTVACVVAAGDRYLMVEEEVNGRLAYNQPYRTALYISRLLSTSLLAVAGVVALYLLARRQLARPQAAVLTAVYALATPALVYSAALYGHQPCADFLLLGLAIPLLTEETAHARLAALATGLCLGLAVVCEYPAAVPVVPIA